eukprot:3436775-Amphidinium_carterae.1
MAFVGGTEVALCKASVPTEQKEADRPKTWAFVERHGHLRPKKNTALERLLLVEGRCDCDLPYAIPCLEAVLSADIKGNIG